MVLALAALLGAGSGAMAGYGPFRMGTAPVAQAAQASGSMPVAAGDTNPARFSFDGDRLSDLVLQSLSPNSNLVEYSSNGSRFMKGQTWATVPGEAGGERPSRLAGDVDGDGNTDAITISMGADEARIDVLLSDGGSFGYPRRWGTLPPALGSINNAFLTGDTNADHRSDLVIAHEPVVDGVESSVLELWVMESSGDSFGPPRRWALLPEVDLTSAKVNMLDLTADGRSDMVVARQNPDGDGVRVDLLVNRGGAFVRRPAWVDENPAWPVRLVPGDFNNDGFDDLALGAMSEQGYTMWEASNDHEGGLRPAWKALPDKSLPDVGYWTTGDYNMDNKADLVRVSDSADGSGLRFDVALSQGDKFSELADWGRDSTLTLDQVFVLGRVG